MHAPAAQTRGDAREFLRALPDTSAACAWFDPQYRDQLDKMKYGNEGVTRQRERRQLPAMTNDYIADCCFELARVLRPSGYAFLWVDTFRLVEAEHLRPYLRNGVELCVADVLKPVALIAWDTGRLGMGHRVRDAGSYLLVLQKPPLKAKATWRDHGIRSRWVETVSRKLHPHAKPIGLIKRLIAAVTMQDGLVVDPAAGSFCVRTAALELGRRFVGVDIMGDPAMAEGAR